MQIIAGKDRERRLIKLISEDWDLSGKKASDLRGAIPELSLKYLKPTSGLGSKCGFGLGIYEQLSENVK
jgi:hypothetical protein